MGSLFTRLTQNFLGLTVIQKHGALEKEWDSKKSARELLQLFQGFANKVLKAITAYDPNLSKELLWKLENFGNL